MKYKPLKEITKKEADKSEAKIYFFKGKYLIYDWDKS